MNKPIFLKTLKQQINCINTEYSNNQIVLSVLTGFIFFVFPASLFITLAVNLIIIYFFYFEIIYAFLFLILFGLAYFSSSKFIETLKNYKISDQIDYSYIKSKAISINAILLALIALIGLLILFSL
jgi:hypothetical protein